MPDINDKSPLPKEDFLRRARFEVVVPANLDAQTSPTSYCEDCYAGQFFSKNLQRFLIDYSLRVSSKDPITDKP